MSKIVLLTLPMTLVAVSAQAAPSADDCATRAAAVVGEIEREAGEPLPLSQARLAYKAALASCQAESGENAATPASDPKDEEATILLAEGQPEDGAFERFVKGFFSQGPSDVKKRPGGKYRYIDKE